MTAAPGDLTRETEQGPIWKFLLYSGIGVFMFFVPITVDGRNSIALDHLVGLIRATAPDLVTWYCLALIVAGVVVPFVTGTWRRSVTDVVFTVLRVGGLAVAVCYVSGFGPAFLFEDSMGPFLWNALVSALGLLIPIGAVFLALLVGYGLMEFIGVFARPFMRPVYRTPGRSAVDAVASFVGSYSLALLITNRVYLEGKYTKREAATIATGFSTVSATFMIVVASTLDLMDHWTLYFWGTLAITFVVTAVSVRIWPLVGVPDQYVEGVTPQPEQDAPDGLFTTAMREARATVARDPGVGRLVLSNLKDGLAMVTVLLPSILSVGLLGLVLAEYTPVFDWLGYVFYPITALLQSPEPLLVGKAAALGVSEMFLPAALVTEEVLAVKFTVAVVCVSQIIFFSAMVPSLVSTRIPVSVPRVLGIWFVRVVLSLIITVPLANLLF